MQYSPAGLAALDKLAARKQLIDTEHVRELFGLSKKAFKRAAGRLLKQGLVSLDAQGCLAPVRAGD